MTTSPTPAADWIDFQVGSPCPVLLEERVEVRLRNGQSRQDQAGALRWSARDDTDGHDIIAYRVVSPTPAFAAKGEAVAIVPTGCTGSSLSFDPGVLHVSKDGGGYIAISEEHFSLEDDRGEGPDGPEGSIHWIVRLDASEMVALRDFLNGTAQPHPSQQAGREAVEAIERDIRALCNGHPHAKIAWPHRELHALADRLAALNTSEARG